MKDVKGKTETLLCELLAKLHAAKTADILQNGLN